MRQMVCVFVVVMTWAAAADAQSTYVGASFIGDIVRTSGTVGGPGNGEAFGGALRVGVPLGEKWGVELEAARTGEIDMAPELAIARTGFSFSSTGGIAPFDDPALFPVPQFDSERRLTTISTMVWWSHEVSPRFSLAYLGGVAFTRSDWHLRYSFPVFPPFPPIPLPQPTPGGNVISSVLRPSRFFEQETVTYDADVAVGFEGRIGMTEHLRLTPGVRLQTAAGGWAIRPGIGLQWMF